MQFGFFKKFIQKVDQLVTGKGRVDADLFEELEETLLEGDLNIHTATELLNSLKSAVQDERMANSGECC